MRCRWIPSLAALVTVALIAAGGCGRATATELPGLRILVPNASGSGYDVTARSVVKALEDSGTAFGVEVFNLPGAGGTVGLQRLIYEEGNGKLMMVMGLGLVGAQHEHASRARLTDTTPIARLLEEPNVVVVRHDSPYRTLEELLAAWRADPAGLAVGGGSRAGGPDHQAPMLVAKQIGIDPRQVDYRQYDGGGRLLPAIIGQEVDFAITGLAQNAQQFVSGQLRVLAVTGEGRIEGLDAPTLQEAGVNVVFSNWRGIVAPPGLSDADVRALQAMMAELHASEQWRRALAANGWTDAYLSGDEFGEFIAQQVAQLEDLLAHLGLG
jgi:putative tricarboxylic transport membrane protein